MAGRTRTMTWTDPGSSGCGWRREMQRKQVYIHGAVLSHVGSLAQLEARIQQYDGSKLLVQDCNAWRGA